MAIAFEEAVTQLRQLILDGTLAPGARLNELELAKQLGTSRTPVREALRALASQSLVTLLPNKGARVVLWSTADLLEIYDLRSMLESHAAELAAGRMRPETIDQLFELCGRMEACVHHGREDNLLTLSELNNEFHRLILDAARSPRLETLITFVVQVPLVARTFARYTPEALDRSMSHHRELVAAFRAGSADWAGSIMKAHILAARTVLVDANAEDPFDGQVATSADGAKARSARRLQHRP